MAARSCGEGKFIAVSGIDGTGKSTLVAELAESLRQRGHKVLTLAGLKSDAAMPSEWLRRIPRDDKTRDVVESWIGGLFTLILYDNAVNRVEPALTEGAWVVTDRWMLDHMANQEALGARLDQWLPVLAQVRRPHLTLLLEAPLDAVEKRIARRGSSGIGSGKRFLSACAAALDRLGSKEAHQPVVRLDARFSAQDVRLLALAAIDATFDVRSGEAD
ncbi:MAG TPA: dTMP kinase [Actinopolymorphaceae bacterium]